MRGPFPTVRLVATGGMTGAKAAEFLQAAASVVGVGRGFADPARTEQLRKVIEARKSTA